MSRFFGRRGLLLFLLGFFFVVFVFAFFLFGAYVSCSNGGGFLVGSPFVWMDFSCVGTMSSTDYLYKWYLNDDVAFFEWNYSGVVS